MFINVKLPVSFDERYLLMIRTNRTMKASDPITMPMIASVERGFLVLGQFTIIEYSCATSVHLPETPVLVCVGSFVQTVKSYVVQVHVLPSHTTLS